MTAPIRLLLVDRLQANDWNPNRMTEAEFAELVAEVRHLGRLPKPIIVRPNGDLFDVVDGEHGWRAAKEVGLGEIPCEVIEVDDFEAMRQTYKRNQHGTHDPVVLGQMFRRMLDERGLSNRALAKEIEVSEGTIRNALIYADAAALRNDYAFERLTVKQVRRYIELPPIIRDAWLDAGADEALLDAARTVEYRRATGGTAKATFWEPGEWAGDSDADMAWSLKQVAEIGLADLFASGRRDFTDALKNALELVAWRMDLSRCFEGEPDQYLVPVLRVMREWWTVSAASLLQYLPIREDRSQRPWRLYCPLPPERWAQVIEDAIDDRYFRRDRMTPGVALALKELGAWEEDERPEDRDPRIRLALIDAPEFVRESAMLEHDKAALAQATVPEMGEDELLEWKRSVIPRLEAKAEVIAGDPLTLEAVQARRLTVDSLIGELEQQRTREQWTAMYGDPKALAKAIVEQLAPTLRTRGKPRPVTEEDLERLPDANLKVGRDEVCDVEYVKTKEGRLAYEVLTEHLRELPFPMLALVAAAVTGEGDPGEVWLRAVNGKDPGAAKGKRLSLADRREFAALEATIAGALG